MCSGPANYGADRTVLSLEKIGLGHLKKERQLKALRERGLETIHVRPDDFVLVFLARYQAHAVSHNIKGKTLCEAIDNAVEFFEIT